MAVIVGCRLGPAGPLDGIISGSRKKYDEAIASSSTSTRR
jgi:hypothetical protein